MYDPLVRLNALIDSYRPAHVVPASQVIKEVDYQNITTALDAMNFPMMTIEEFCNMKRGDAVRLYHEGKLLMVKARD